MYNLPTNRLRIYLEKSDHIWEHKGFVLPIRELNKVKQGYRHGLDRENYSCYTYVGNELRENPHLYKHMEIYHMPSGHVAHVALIRHDGQRYEGNVDKNFPHHLYLKKTIPVEEALKHIYY